MVDNASGLTCPCAQDMTAFTPLSLRPAMDCAASAEAQRAAALGILDVLDSPPDNTLSQLVELASWTFNVPMATLSLFDAPAVCHKAHFGLPAAHLHHPEALGMEHLLRQGYCVLADANQDPAACEHPWVKGQPGVKFFAAVALCTADGVNVGSLAIMDTLPRELSDREARMLSAMARLAMDHLALQSSARKTARLHAELEQSHGWLLDSVAQDTLTQVANRRALMGFLDKSVSLARREGHALSVLLLDLRDFKRVNEQFGDVVGDRVLHEVATRLASCARGSELVGRMAGDEFMAVLYPCTEEQARMAAERFALAAVGQPVTLGAMAGQAVALQVMTGTSTMGPEAPQTSDELYRRAARALDEAKAAARAH